MEDEKPSPAQIKILKDLCLKHKVNLEYWISSNGKSWDTLSADDVGMMLNSIKEKYGDE